MDKKLSKYMKINRIEFIVTWQCGGRCKHCQIGAQINKSGSHYHIQTDYAVEAIRKLSTVFGISSVMTFGGEPLYYPDVVAAIHRAATECGVETRQIITNGYFTNSAKKSESVSQALVTAGVNNLLLSVDAFHQEHIPLKPVLQFAKDIVKAKLPGAFLYPAWLVAEEDENPYNIKTREILERFRDISIHVSRGNHVFLGGNAAAFLGKYFESEKIDLTVDCGSMPYCDPLDIITSISIVPNGDFMVCGFVVGNIYQDDILDIVAGYDPYQHEGMRAILEGGVSRLLSYAKEQGIAIDASKYRSACDVCHEVARQIANSSNLSGSTALAPRLLPSFYRSH